MPTEEPSEEENLLGATDEESTALKSKQPNRLVTRQGNSREKEIPVLKNMSVNESAIEKDSGEKPTVEETGGESTSDEDKPEKKGKSLVKPVIKGGGPTSSAEDSSSMGHDRKVSNTSQTSLPSDSGDSQENGSSEKAITTTTTSKPSNGQTVVEQGKGDEPAPSQEDDKKEEHKSNDAGAEDNTATTPHTTKQSYHDITPESTESPQESSSSAIPEIFGHPNGRQIEESSPASKTTKRLFRYRKPNSTDTSSTEDTSQEKSTTSNPQEKSEPLKSEETSSTAGSPHHNPDTTDESEEDDDIVSAKPKSNIVSKPVYEEEDDKATTAEPLQKTTTIKDSQEKSRPLNDESTETATTSTTTVEKYDQKPMETTDTSDKEVSEEFEKGTGTTPKTLKRQEDSSEQGTETGSKLPKKDLKSHPESDQEVDSQEKPTSKHPDHDASMPENISESDEQVSPENPTKKPASLEKSEPLANTSPSLHQEISTYTTPAAGSPDGREVEGNIESDGENPHDKEKPLKSEHGSADHYPSSEISTLGKYAKNSTLNPKQESNYMPLSSEDVSQDTTEKPKKEKSTTEGNPQDDSQPLSNESPEMPTTIMYERMTTISPHKDISSNSLETSLEPRHRTIHKSPQLESTPLSDESEETTNISGQRKGVTTDKPKPTGKSVTESEKSKENSRSPNGFDTSGGGENSSTTTIKKDGHGTTMTPEFTANLPLYLTENTTTTTTKPHEENGRANVVEKTTSSPESDSTTDDYGDIDGRLGQGIDDEPLEIGISEDDKPVLKSHTNIDMPISGSQSSEESTSITAQPYTSSQNQEDEETAPSDSHQPSNEDRREKENPEESEEPESREDQSKQIPDKPDDSQEETPSLTMPDSEEGEGKSIEKHPKDQQTSIITDEAEESEIPDTQRQNSVEIAIKQPEKITHKNTHHKPTATAPKISGDSREIVVEKEKRTPKNTLQELRNHILLVELREKGTEKPCALQKIELMKILGVKDNSGSEEERVESPRRGYGSGGFVANKITRRCSNKKGKECEKQGYTVFIKEDFSVEEKECKNQLSDDLCESLKSMCLPTTPSIRTVRYLRDFIDPEDGDLDKQLRYVASIIPDGVKHRENMKNAIQRLLDLLPFLDCENSLTKLILDRNAEEFLDEMLSAKVEDDRACAKLQKKCLKSRDHRKGQHTHSESIRSRLHCKRFKFQCFGDKSTLRKYFATILMDYELSRQTKPGRMGNKKENVSELCAKTCKRCLGPNEDFEQQQPDVEFDQTSKTPCDQKKK
uniref:Uncharacterized protein n=1 Tax=Ditylenchus dipsaci TaxID=166011 RepID=A0A915EH60_9BILA